MGEFEEKERISKAGRMLVAAIDFGTTYSGYAYSFKHDWATVQTNTWSGEQQVSYKAPTALLLNPDKSFKAFGFEAETFYSSLTSEDDDSCKEYYFFQRFKLILKTKLEERVHRNTECLDINGKSVDAMSVFMHCIEYLKSHMLEALNDSKGFEIKITDIDFVLTVPAIWDDTAKMFMREAAIKAGIPGDQLLFALEPEAASIYCQLMYLEPQNNSSFRITEKDSNAKYMVVDLGGGTADITIHQMQRTRTIIELTPASGGLWGGTRIDENFGTFLNELFDKEAMKKFRTDSAEDYFDFWQRFEVKKRAIDFETENIHLQVPLELLSIIKKINKEKDINKIIEKSKWKGKGIKFAQKKLHIPTTIMKSIFQATTDEIINHLTKLVKEVGQGLKVILLVGGFSECGLIQNQVREAFEIKGKCRVIIPNQCGLAVLKGAVYFGHHPEMISERVARYTYGIQIWPKFIKGEHKEEKRDTRGSEDRCRDVFFKFVTKGDRVKAGFSKSHIFRALKSAEGDLECGIFISNKENPKYVDEDGCEKLGILKIDVERGAEVEESLIFGHTELHAGACNCTTKAEYRVTFDLLSEKIKFPTKTKS
ncbi:heat shock 70 kDa protein 12A-like isoform X3 [Saccostrea echinata]|uniref:heat shock 70 kDa protein 12A-like isoform X3 n=1 Tax=Saccostrea echinata TaxID=191078 RepID=UPI002A82FDBF|nr:heat shock 70 kDa protein 12A-like isoform X3 [Saccostrea echinata]